MDRRAKEQEIANTILDQLEQAEGWHKCWRGAANYITGKEYRGINQAYLSALSMKRKVRNQWLTYKQAAEAGYQVKAGSKAAAVEFHLWLEDEATLSKQYKGCKFYFVFSIDDLTNPPEDKPRDLATIPEPQAIIDNMPHRPQFRHEGIKALYSPSWDLVLMPDFNTFDTGPDYYSTAFHELAHSTGHPKRLHRFEVAAAEELEDYAQEELVAEFTAAFLCGYCNIDQTMKNSKAYIAHWFKQLRKHPDGLLKGIAAAQKAADFITNYKPEAQPTQAQAEE